LKDIIDAGDYKQVKDRTEILTQRQVNKTQRNATFITAEGAQNKLNNEAEKEKMKKQRL